MDERDGASGGGRASMKVPPKRKGNTRCRPSARCRRRCLNESPSEKEGKSVQRGIPGGF